MKFLEDIVECVTDAITSAKLQGESSACCTYNCNCGYIDIWCNNRDDVEVCICQDHDKELDHPRLETAIAAVIPCWNDVEIEEEEPSDWITYYGRI